MVVKARTVYTKELTIKYLKFNNLKSSKRVGFCVVIELLTFAYIAYTFISAIARGRLEDIRLDIIPWIILLFFVPFMVFVFPVLSVRLAKHPFEMANTFKFTDTEMIVKTVSLKGESQGKIAIARFETVYDTRDAFYLYVSKREMYLIQKADIYEGSVSDLQNILRSNIPAKKYIVKNF